LFRCSLGPGPQINDGEETAPSVREREPWNKSQMQHFPEKPVKRDPTVRPQPSSRLE